MIKIADKCDIVAPWIGLPTAGFTRAMTQYNWYANTKSCMLQFDYEFETIPDLKVMSRFVVQDFDDEKIGVKSTAILFWDLDIVFVHIIQAMMLLGLLLLGKKLDLNLYFYNTYN